MKWAVIAGVLQMVFGIILKCLNSVYFKKPLVFIFEFIPQIIFMTGLFG
jgi:V-type H+-transporting ATPase subunit a